MKNELIQSIKEYKENINTGKIITNEHWNCIECKKDFAYRPFICAVICNDCLLLKGQRIEMDNKAPYNYCSICSALLPDHTTYCSKFELISTATNADDTTVTMFHRCTECGQEWYSDIINAEKHPCFKKL